MSDWTVPTRMGLNVVNQLLLQKRGKSNSTHKQLTRRERLGVLMAEQSYKDPDDRQYKVKNYKYVKDLSSDKYAVYKNRRGRYQVTIRGTVPKHGLGDHSGDLGQDIDIMKGKFNENSAQVKETQRLIDRILTADPGAKGKIGLNGHSLGGRISLEVLHSPKYTHAIRDSVALAPGFSPLGAREELKRQENLVKKDPHRNFVVGVSNDTVWSGNKAMHKDLPNVKILPAVDPNLSGTHKNHFLTAFTQKKEEKPAGSFRPPMYFHKKKTRNFLEQGA